MNEESKQGAPGGASPVCDVCGRQLNKRLFYASDQFVCGDEETCYQLGYERANSSLSTAEKEIRDRDATHVMCNKVLREEVPALRAKARGALENAVGVVAHARAHYAEDIFSPDGTSPECGHAKWARNLLDGIMKDIRRLVGDAAEPPKASEIASDSSALEKALGALRAFADHESEPWKGLREVAKLLLMGIAETDWQETEMRARELLVLLAGAPELFRQMAALSGGAHVDALKAQKDLKPDPPVEPTP